LKEAEAKKREQAQAQPPRAAPQAAPAGQPNMNDLRSMSAMTDDQLKDYIVKLKANKHMAQ
jgi:hypothetical protein